METCVLYIKNELLLSIAPSPDRNQKANACFRKRCLQRAMVQYKSWYRKACGDRLQMRTAERFFNTQLLKRHFRRMKVSLIYITCPSSYSLS